MELSERQIPFEEKPRLRPEYKGRPLKQEYEPDLLCFGETRLQVKAVQQLSDEHRARAIDHMEATGKQLTLLLNSGHHPKTEHERFVNHPLSRVSRVS
ncbi:GxxExxY protein [Myxococcota bacterium]|nr:GxxExxY protein [Myxococcota bacterium]